MTDASGTTTWGYHPDTGLPATETRTPLVGDPTTVGWAYDEEGRRVQMTVDGLPATHQTGTWQTIYNYDRYGRLQLIQDDRAHSSKPFTYSYASGTGLLEQIDSPWRTGSGTEPYLRQTRAHDTFGRLTDIATLNSTGTVSQRVTGITYDRLDRRTDLSLLGGTLYASQQSRAYDYDGYGQLKEEQVVATITQAYEYDPIGNRLNWWQGDPDSTTPTEYTPDAVNQYTDIQVSGLNSQPSYDADGSLLSDSTWTYTWNGANRLIGMEPIGTPAEGDHKLTFTYDGLGRRVSKTVETWNQTTENWETDESVAFVYDGWNLIAEVQTFTPSDLPTFILLTSYTWGLDLSASLQGAGGVGGLLAVTESEGSNDSTYMPSYDLNGNVMGYFDTSTETLVAEYEYGPFGELIRATGSKKDEFNFRFSTKYQDAETGLLYYGFRYYDPVTGRWPSRDPIAENGGLNLYGMVGNNPVNFWDYLGLRRESTFVKRRRIQKEFEQKQCIPCKSGRWVGSGSVVQAQFAIGYIEVSGTYKCVGQEDELTAFVIGEDLLFGMAGGVSLSGFNDFEEITGVKNIKNLKGKIMLKGTVIAKGGIDVGVVAIEASLNTNDALLAGGGDTSSGSVTGALGFKGGAKIITRQ